MISGCLTARKKPLAQTLTEDNTGAVATAIKATPGSIGYVSIGFVTGPNKNDISPICIDGAKAVAADISSGTYKFWGVEHMYTKGNANAYEKALMQYILSDQVQKNDLVRLSYIPIGQWRLPRLLPIRRVAPRLPRTWANPGIGILSLPGHALRRRRQTHAPSEGGI